MAGTARTQAKLDQARALGLDYGVRAGVTIVVDALASCGHRGGRRTMSSSTWLVGRMLAVDLESAAMGGRIVIVGTLAGRNVELPLLQLMGKRLGLHGTVLRARSITDKAAATAAVVGEVLPAAFASGRRLRPVVDRIFPLEEAADAYALVESDATFGKGHPPRVILKISWRPIIGPRLSRRPQAFTGRS